MACFLVPAAEAVVTAAAVKITKKKESKCKRHDTNTIPFSRKISWLRNMLAGGSALLAFEHLWHGEITPWFPFLTAAGNPADTAEMLHEMAVSGTSMAALVTLVWGVMAVAADIIAKRPCADNTKRGVAK